MIIKQTITIHKNLLGHLENNLKNLTPVLSKIASDLQDASEDAFEKQGPRWRKLKPKTIAARKRRKKWPGKILNISGASGLKGSINTKIEKTSVYIGSNKEYAAVHQYGSPKKNIPSRPFLVIGKKEIKMAELHLVTHLMKK